MSSIHHPITFSWAFQKQPATARRTEQASRMSSPCSCDHANASSVESTYGRFVGSDPIPRDDFVRH